MFCFAAYTGARRSEMLCCRIGDVDLDGQTAILREKKKAKDKRTMRRVPLSDSLTANSGSLSCG
jgi:integrase